MRSREHIWLDSLEAAKGSSTMERMVILMSLLEVQLDIRELLISLQRNIEERKQD